jgi:hypothetical protein
MHTTIESESLKERYPFGDLNVDEMVIFEYEFMWLRIIHVKVK